MVSESGGDAPAPQVPAGEDQPPPAERDLTVEQVAAAYDDQPLWPESLRPEGWFAYGDEPFEIVEFPTDIDGERPSDGVLRGLVQYWRPVPPDQATVAERYVSITEFDTTETLRANVDATVARWVEADDLAVADVEYRLLRAVPATVITATYYRDDLQDRHRSVDRPVPLAVVIVEAGRWRLQVRESNADTKLPELRAHVVRLAELWLDAIAERVG